jgi:hypothetical protein
MIGVYFRDEQWYVRLHAVMPGITEDGYAGTGEIGFDLASYLRGQR